MLCYCVVVFLTVLHNAMSDSGVSDEIEYTVSNVPKVLFLEPQQVVR